MEKSLLKKHLYAVVICGGGGTRLWPRSRNKTPKQFSRLFDKETLFQKTVNRLSGLVSPEKIIAVTVSQAYAREIKKEAPKIPWENIIWEPMRRDTAIACGLGTLLAQKRDPKAVVMNFWADHLVQKEAVFKKVELAASQAAFEAQTLVAIGIKPERPHTGLGYIHAGKVIKKIDGLSVFKLEKFVEKPNLAKAKQFISSGDYYWNSGMYVWSAEFFMKALKKYSPATSQALEKVGRALGTKKQIAVMKAAYKQAPTISVDVAVSEKVKGALIVPAQMGWNDIGDWSVIYKLVSKDKEGNAVIKFGDKGEFVGLNAEGNLVQFDDQLIALVGVKDLIVVDTTDAILICPRNRAQDVKKLVKLLREKKKTEYL